MDGVWGARAGGLGVLFACLGLCAASAQSTRLAFSVASVKRNLSEPSRSAQNMGPGRVALVNITLREMIRFAYDLPEFQLDGGPPWVRSDRFDVTATADPNVSSFENYRVMMQSLLEDRFKLVLRTERRRMTGFVVSLGRKDGRLGRGFERAPDNCNTPEGRRAPKPRPILAGGGSTGSVGMGDCEDLATMVRGFARMAGAPVLDKTGLQGRWNFTLYFSSPGVPGAAPASDYPLFADAVREQLGLKVDRQTTEADVLVIETVQRPTEN